MNWNNSITQQLFIEYPIIQAPMFGVTTPAMVAAAANTGCLGSLPLGDLPAEKSIAVIRATKQLCKHPFAVNMFVNEIPAITGEIKAKYAAVKAFIEHLARQHQLQVKLPDIGELQLNNYEEKVDTIIAEDCKIVSFTFGNLNEQSIQKLKSNGTVLIGTCTSVKEAILLEQSGIDILCVQGMEAGGHRGSFATVDNIPAIGGFSLLPQVYDAVSIPIIYAGGIYNANTLLAAKTLGAQGFQIGSLLLGSAESALKGFEKERLQQVKETDIVLTKSFTGRYARGIKNTLSAAIEGAGQILPYPYQNKLTSELRKAAKANGNLDFVSIWLGQSIHSFSKHSTTEILKELIAATETEHNN